jgi:hypothetical protein
MKYLILLFLCSISYQSETKETKTNSFPEKKALSVNTDSCIYPKRKQKAQHLKYQFEQNPDKLNEVNLTTFIIDSLLPCWYGTPWDFNGTTLQPGNGTIACGYFVTTVLQDAGINLNRIKLSQCASEEMIKKLSLKNSITRFRNKSITQFAESLKQKEKGLYIIGLDFHTGFIYHNGEELFFIHASYAYPKVVRKEKVTQSSVLASSKYKVIGKVNFFSSY